MIHPQNTGISNLPSHKNIEQFSSLFTLKEFEL